MTPTFVDSIRNFCIVAHIDHGKSTLADRFLECTGALSPSQITNQVLDSMELERERGITIKAKTVRMSWKGHILNLIDTPGHVDFTFEVHRALWACEGALLLVDASQGVQAQTVANFEIAREAGLKVLMVVNKIDLSNARPEEAALEMMEITGLNEEPFFISAKTGRGTEELLDAIVAKIPPPQDIGGEGAAALIFDSFFDAFQGVVLLVRLFAGTLKTGSKIQFAHDAGRKIYLVEEVGYLTPARRKTQSLQAGEVGYLCCGIRDPRRLLHGETVMEAQAPRPPLRPMVQVLKPFVFVGMYPPQTGEADALRVAFEKLRLGDSSFEFMPEHSVALGPGFRCGFLGLLHLEIIQERLRREFALEVIVTNPNVRYRIRTRKGEMLEVTNPSQFPAYGDIREVEEPFVKLKILTDAAFLGAIQELIKSRRGIFVEMRHLTPTRLQLIWEMPLAEMVVDFYDRLKSVSRGYASMDYELIGWRFQDKLVKADVLIHGESCDALSFIVPEDRAYDEGRRILERLKEVVPRQMFDVNLQVAANGRIIAKERLAGIKKDVLAKCYGGDITRKMKLLAKQREGKKKMRMVGKVELPPEAFLTVMRKISEGPSND